MTDTVTWLKDSLIRCCNGPVLYHAGRQWKPVAAFRQAGSILCIYEDSTEYCVHGGDSWDSTAPNLGYYDIDLPWDELVSQIAERYDNIRSNLVKTDP